MVASKRTREKKKHKLISLTYHEQSNSEHTKRNWVKAKVSWYNHNDQEWIQNQNRSHLCKLEMEMRKKRRRKKSLKFHFGLIKIIVVAVSHYFSFNKDPQSSYSLSLSLCLLLCVSPVRFGLLLLFAFHLYRQFASTVIRRMKYTDKRTHFEANQNTIAIQMLDTSKAHVFVFE